MGDGTQDNPYTREDVLRLIEENGGKAEGLDLSGRVFEEGIDLHGLNLKGIILVDAHLEGANINKAHLEGADLRDAYIERALLENAHLERTSLQGAHLERASLVLAHLEGAHLSNAHLERADLVLAHLEGTDLSYACLESTRLAGVRLSSETRLETAEWGNYILADETPDTFEQAENIYRRLKQWYTNAGMYDIAGEFFYREMEVKRKARSWKKEPASKLWSWVIRLLCGYGERYGNVVVAALVIIFGLAVVYVYGGLNLAYAIYFSAVSFTALGYGSWVNITPEGWVRALGAVESFLGVFMMALFLVTFIRKMTR